MKQKPKLRNFKKGIPAVWPKGVPKPRFVKSSELGKFSNPQMQELYDALGEAMFMRFCTLIVEIHVRWLRTLEESANPSKLKFIDELFESVNLKFLNLMSGLGIRGISNCMYLRVPQSKRWNISMHSYLVDNLHPVAAEQVAKLLKEKLACKTVRVRTKIIL